MKEEIFGPILPVITFNHFSEVIKIINSLDKPLVVYYYSKNHTGDNFKLLEEQTSSGALICNESMF
jgi:acyl-CoA reductase-like NAD-dependent aldehyde dehydrogenase